MSGGHGAFVFPRLRPTRLGRVALRRATASVAWLRVAGCLALLGVMTGCQTYTAQTAQRDVDVRRGSLDAAVLRANADALRNDGGKDAVLFRLEQGGDPPPSRVGPDPGAAAGTVRPHVVRS